jgi:hypothetical protein
MAEITRHQIGSEPGRESIDAEHGQPQPLGEHAGVGHHIGASLQDRADATMTGDERVSGREDVTLGHGDGEPFERNVAAGSFAYPLGQESRRLLACALQVKYSLQRPWMPMRLTISGGSPATAIGVEA